MISSKKHFGAYVLHKPQFEEIDNNSSFASTCSIPPYWTALQLISVTVYNHDTSIFRFRLPDGVKHLGLPVGAYLLVRAPNCEHGGGDAIRPYTSIRDASTTEVTVSPKLDESNSEDTIGWFEVICKRYDQWGQKESIQTHFLFTKTDHSYRPPGAVSNYIHNLSVGQSLEFKHDASCVGRVDYPFPGCKRLMMIAVGAGVSPMISIIRAVLNDITNREQFRLDNREGVTSIEEVVLFYGVRTVKDILMREILDHWHNTYELKEEQPTALSNSCIDLSSNNDNNSIIDYCGTYKRHCRFKVVYCVGSRWQNVHWGARNNAEYVAPPPPVGFKSLKLAELGWVNKEAIEKHGFSPAEDTRVIVCGLPGVYEKLCGDRNSKELLPGSVLNQLGYSNEMVTKL